MTYAGCGRGTAMPIYSHSRMGTFETCPRRHVSRSGMIRVS